MNLIKLLLEFNKISREISNKGQGKNLPKFLYEKLNKLVEMDAFSLGKIEDEKIFYRFYVENGEIFENIEKKFVKEKSLSYYSVSKNKVVIINDFDEEVFDYVKGISSTGDSIKYNSILVYPFKIKNKVKGFFSVQIIEKNYFTQEKIILFKEIAQYIETIYNQIENESIKNNNSDTFEVEKSNITNPIREFTNNLIKNVATMEDLVAVFLSSLTKNFGLKELDLEIYKEFSNKTFYFISRERIEKVESINNENKKNIILEINENYLGKIYIKPEDMEKLDETFVVFMELFVLNLYSLIEKEELEFENKEKNHLVKALENSYINLIIINEMVKNITSTMDLKEVGRRVYNGLIQIFNSDCAVALAYYDEEKEKLEYDILIDYGDEFNLGVVNKIDKTSFASWVVRNKKSVIINDYELEAKNYIDVTEGHVGTTETNSLIYLPLYKDEKIIGVFSVQKKEKDFFNNYQIEIVKGIGSFVNIALINLIETRLLSKEIEEKKKYEKKLEKINKKLIKISSLDSLTKLYNRRHFEKLVKEFWMKAINEKKDIGFMIFDLDYFKEINDTYGHLEGDRALLEIAGIIKSYVKPDVKFGRYGGDEFVGLIYDSDEKELLKMGQEINEALKSKKIKCPNTETGILSLTMGVTVFSPIDEKGIDELFLKADEALYKGKELGRNQIIFMNQEEKNV